MTGRGEDVDVVPSCAAGLATGAIWSVAGSAPARQMGASQSRTESNVTRSGYQAHDNQSDLERSRAGRQPPHGRCRCQALLSPGTLRRDYLRHSPTRTRFLRKGKVSSYHIGVNGQTSPDAAWYYPKPLPPAPKIRDHVAFWYRVAVKQVLELRQVLELPHGRSPWTSRQGVPERRVEEATVKVLRTPDDRF
ncbi:MAG: DUF427 domain-containing protein, partial [Acidimicrobiales bacterium]